MEQKVSDLGIEIWQERFFNPLEKRGFGEDKKGGTGSSGEPYDDGEAPPEYKNRKRHQGPQRRYSKVVNERTIFVLTSHSRKTDAKKESYFIWVFMQGRKIDGKLWSSPILDTPSAFETALQYVDAFIDISEHWPTCPQCGFELVLEHMRKENIMHMMKFECHDTTTVHREYRPSFIFPEGLFSETTVRFLKKKYMPAYRSQLKGKIVGSKRINTALKRKEAFQKK